MSEHITLENAADFVGKKVDCYKRLWHYYPLKVIKGVNAGGFYIVDRNAVAMPIGENDKIPYDFIVEAEDGANHD